MRVAIPTDPSAPIQGIAVLRDLPNSATGNPLILDLTATATDAQGRPTPFPWGVDAASAGSDAGAPDDNTLPVLHGAKSHSKSSAGGPAAVFTGSILPDPRAAGHPVQHPQVQLTLPTRPPPSASGSRSGPSAPREGPKGRRGLRAEKPRRVGPAGAGLEVGPRDVGWVYFASPSRRTRRRSLGAASRRPPTPSSAIVDGSGTDALKR